jgi:hypothetical protein
MTQTNGPALAVRVPIGSELAAFKTLNEIGSIHVVFLESMVQKPETVPDEPGVMLIVNCVADRPVKKKWLFRFKCG